MPKRRNSKQLRSDLRFDGLVEYFTDKPRLFRDMCDVIETKRSVSLRSLEYLCTRFAPRENISFVTETDVTRIHDVYRNALNTLGKDNFDAFKRNSRRTVELHGRKLVTTVAQMTFFKLMQQHGIIDYARRNIQTIEASMSSDLRVARAAAKRIKGTKRPPSPSASSEPKKIRRPVVTMAVMDAPVKLSFLSSV